MFGISRNNPYGVLKTGAIRAVSAGLLWATTAALAVSAQAASVNIGSVSYDEGTSAPNIATFDITNLTGANAIALGDPTDFPVNSPVSLTNLDLTVTFQNGTTQSFGQSAFTLGSDGLSFDGPGVVFGTSNDALSATLTGDFATTSLTLANGTTPTILSAFSTTITDSSGGVLQDGDTGVITATTTTVVPGTPEPATWLLMTVGLLGGLLLRRKKTSPGTGLRPMSGTAASVAVMGLVVGAVTLLPSTSVFAAVSLSTVSTPTSGVAGTSKLNLTSAGLPGGTVASTLQVNLAPTCGVGSSVSGEVSTTANSVTTIVGVTKRINFTLPASLAKGSYYAWVSGPSATDDSVNCAVVVVTTSNATLNACVPSSSLAVAFGTNVTAYVPNGAWDFGGTGVQAVTLEGSGAPVTIPTANGVNACSSNPATGETVCTGNNTDVYLINGTTLTSTLTSGANTFAGFSGGECENCGVAINALTNTAYISGGYSGSSSNDGIQPLSLATNTFGAPFPTAHSVSENISIDPSRNLILSPGEDGVYDLLSLNSAGAIVAENGNAAGGTLDSAAEDCTTGIATSSDEGTSYIYLSDLTQASFTAGSPGFWTAPGQFVYVGGDAGGGFAAGTDGISVAPGSGHLGLVTGEFGGNTVTVFQLPATSGSGTPALADYAYFTLPSTPDGFAFTAGFDPHTITAYTSPNSGKAYGVLADWEGYYLGGPINTTYLAVVDLAGLLAQDRGGTAHTVNPTIDLIAAGVVRYVPTQIPTP